MTSGRLPSGPPSGLCSPGSTGPTQVHLGSRSCFLGAPAERACPEWTWGSPESSFTPLLPCVHMWSKEGDALSRKLT